MSNLKIAFDILSEDKEPPPAYTKSSGHLVFDVRMTFERKDRWAKDGHKTSHPDWCTYTGIVSSESVRVALTYASSTFLFLEQTSKTHTYWHLPQKCTTLYVVQNLD